jgi:hypothetical protein
MALSDRYNRGGGRLENLDRYLTVIGDRFGNYWRDRTSTSRATLTQGLYLLSAWAATQHVAISHDPALLGLAGISVLALLGKLPTARGGLVEEIQGEALGLPRRTFALLRLWVLGLGLFNLAMAAGELVLAIQTGSPPLGLPSLLLTGCALTALQAGEYIRRTNPRTPSGGRWVA